MTNIEDAVGFWFMEKDGEAVSLDMAEVEFLKYLEGEQKLICRMRSGVDVHVEGVDQELYGQAQRMWRHMKRPAMAVRLTDAMNEGYGKVAEEREAIVGMIEKFILVEERGADLADNAQDRVVHDEKAAAYRRAAEMVRRRR